MGIRGCLGDLRRFEFGFSKALERVLLKRLRIGNDCGVLRLALVQLALLVVDRLLGAD